METINYRGRYISALSTFAEAGGAQADAALVTAVLHRPDGTATTALTPAHIEGTGLYSCTFIGDDTEQLGLYKVVWTVTGNSGVAGGTHVDTFIVSSV